MSNTPSIPVVVVFSLEDQVFEYIKSCMPKCTYKIVDTYDFEKLMENPDEEVPVVVLCGNQSKEVSANEAAQFFRSIYQESSIYYITKEPANLDKDLLKKNGFNDIFVLTLDKSVLKTALLESASKVGAIKSYRPVKLLDLEPGEPLDFDLSIYLPVNNKYVRCSSAGDDIDKEKIERLNRFQVNSLYVSTDQMKKFYDYSAQKISKLGQNKKISETERVQKMEEMVRDLFTSLTNPTKEATFDQGKAMLATCKNIVSSYVNTTSSSNLYQEIVKVADEMKDSYAHAGNVSTYAALFSLGTRIGKPEELAMAGLLHDLGLANVPMEIQEKAENERSTEEETIYQKHVQDSIDMIKAKKMILTGMTLQIITQHHEYFNGSGYPKQLSHDRICSEAQLLAIADHFDELVTIKKGRARMMPDQAIRKILSNSVDPSKSRFHPDIVKAIVKLFPEKK